MTSAAGEVAAEAVVVRAEVNHGNGGKRIDWMITGVAPVAGVTIDAAALRAAEERFDAHVAARAGELEALLAAAEAEARRASEEADAAYAPRLYRAGREPARQRQPAAVAREVRCLWDPQERVLRVLWVETRGARWTNRYEVRTEPPDPHTGRPAWPTA